MNMNSYETLVKNSSDIEERIGYTFKDKKLLALAFVHRSFFNEHRDLVEEHNERLEFLGDAVFGLIVSDYLYKTLLCQPEGRLSYLRAQIIEAPSCAYFVKKLNIDSFLLLGKGEKRGDGRGRETILADFFEALLGSIFLDGGLEAASLFFYTHFQEDLNQILSTPTRNWKAELQDYSQKRYQKPPQYIVVKESGPDHKKIFQVTVHIDDELIASGEGSSKKEAEVASAEQALLKLEIDLCKTEGALVDPLKSE